MKTQSFVILWDFPESAKSNLSQFYRRLRELLAEQGGSAQSRATKSAYIISGESEHARALAYAIAALASRFGAGAVGEQDGVAVLPLGEIAPDQHFAALAQARQVVEALCVDRRTRANKRAPRGVEAANPKADALAWPDLAAFVEGLGARRADASLQGLEANEVHVEVAK